MITKILIRSVLAVCLAVPGATPAQDILITDFSKGFEGWTQTGDAFRSGPTTGSEIPRLQIWNSPDGIVASSERDGGDRPTGRLLSPRFQIERDYISYRIGGGDYERHNCMNLLVDGEIVRSATGRNTDLMQLSSWDVKEFRGKEAQIEIVDEATGDWGHINVDQLIQTDEPVAKPENQMPLYGEPLRPQFHFTGRQWTMNRLNPGQREEGWVNDLNGMVYYDGEYHMFVQRWNKCWVHAVSKDMVHWEELPPAFWEPTLGFGVQSGSAVIDYGNTSGLSRNPTNPAMVAFASGNDNRSQNLFYSLDHGRTWTAYEKNPVLSFPERDPKVFWYEPGRHWVLFLSGHNNQYVVFTSKNLIDWENTNSPIGNSFECPDFFELPVDGNPANKKWVLVRANGEYSIGRFDGKKFTEETKLFPIDWNDSNYYATQSFNNTEKADGRRVQMAWIRGSNFPEMPFSQQISFPCELTLHKTKDGIRMFRKPVKEIESLHASEETVRNRVLKPGETVELAKSGDLFRVLADVKIKAGSKLIFNLRGVPVELTSGTVVAAGVEARTIDEVHNIEILLDRASLEVFVNGGEACITKFIIPEGSGISVKSEGAPVDVDSLRIIKLKSALPSET